MEFNITFLGTAASVPSRTRGLPAILMQLGPDLMLFDCGEGTQRQMVQAGLFHDVDAIFISHLHIDHWFGLPTVLKSFELRERSKPLTVYGPSKLIQKMNAVKSMVGPIDSFPIEYVEFNGGVLHDTVKRDGYIVVPFEVDHRARCFGFLIQEDAKPGRLDVEKAKALGVSSGPDMGRLTRGEIVNGVNPSDVIGESRRGRRIVYTGDTRPCRGVETFGADADVLIHEATFLHEDVDRAAKVGHSTAKQAGQVLKACQPKLGVLTHIGARYPSQLVCAEARTEFPKAVVADDFDVIYVPVPDKGPPAFSQAV
jgi:ribonuclease Z